MGFIGLKRKRNRKEREKKKEENKTGKARTVLRSDFHNDLTLKSSSQAMAWCPSFALWTERFGGLISGGVRFGRGLMIWSWARESIHVI